MLQFQHILIATDFSPAAWQAIRTGISFAKIPNCKVSLLHVYPYREKQIDQNEKNHFDLLAKKIKRMASELAIDNDLQIDSAIGRGSVSDVISDYVKRKQIDLILMGANSGNLDSHLGSQTTLVIESVPIPVMVVPPVLEAPEIKSSPKIPILML